MNTRDSRAGRATLASSSAIAALLIGRDLHALSRMAGVHAARGAPPRRALAAQLEADDVAPLRAWWPVAALELAGRWIAHRGAAWSTLIERPLRNDARAGCALAARLLRRRAPLRRAKIRGGNRWPAAAPVKLRRFRDG
ncbi:hypothetical protein F511_47266 [Dorcoceras hygrometricum]|uniref:Uncharacterized protein n=1 Tax=Dorcoceras hygrometricum TaxID=472368 RepID=A0A2Z6ZS13_9LAMI|nr:hypothetical protein F511_47266 [Dorcoceras hygrometricum]